MNSKLESSGSSSESILISVGKGCSASSLCGSAGTVSDGISEWSRDGKASCELFASVASIGCCSIDELIVLHSGSEMTSLLAYGRGFSSRCWKLSEQSIWNSYYYKKGSAAYHPSSFYVSFGFTCYLWQKLALKTTQNTQKKSTSSFGSNFRSTPFSAPTPLQSSKLTEGIALTFSFGFPRSNWCKRPLIMWSKVVCMSSLWKWRSHTRSNGLNSRFFGKICFHSANFSGSCNSANYFFSEILRHIYLWRQKHHSLHHVPAFRITIRHKTISHFYLFNSSPILQPEGPNNHWENINNSTNLTFKTQTNFDFSG